jgi:AraC-like DNA-binding protein
MGRSAGGRLTANDQDRRSVEHFVRACQELAGRAADAGSLSIAQGLRDLHDAVPQSPSVSERLLIGHLFARAVSRLTNPSEADTDPAVRAALVALELADVTSDSWYADLEHFVAQCAAAVDKGPPFSKVSASRFVRVTRIVRLVEERYADRISLRTTAPLAGLSVWHAARLLKDATGLSFSEHLHRARVAAGKRLLLETTHSMKEIAIEVGYANSSRFGRYFKRLTSTTPTAFRLRHFVVPVAGAKSDHK